MKEALGLVETRGLSTAVLTADTMVKTSNVHIINIENTKGLGYMTIKVIGDVGAVNAAVTAGRKIAVDNNAFVSAKVIPRPSEYIEGTFCQPKKEKTEPKDEKIPKVELTTKSVKKTKRTKQEDAHKEDIDEKIEKVQEIKEEKEQKIENEVSKKEEITQIIIDAPKEEVEENKDTSDAEEEINTEDIQQEEKKPRRSSRKKKEPPKDNI